MSLDEFTPDIESSEGGWNSAEASKEVSEKFKEAVKKAKKYDFLLANFLVKIIVDKKYDPILERLFKTMDYNDDGRIRYHDTVVFIQRSGVSQVTV